MLTAFKELLDTVPDPYVLVSFSKNAESKREEICDLWPSRALCKIINIPSSSNVSDEQRSKFFAASLPIIMGQPIVDAFKCWLVVNEFAKDVKRSSGCSLQMSAGSSFSCFFKKGNIDEAVIGSVCEIEWSGRLLDEEGITSGTSMILLKAKILNGIVHSSFLTHTEASNLQTELQPKIKVANDNKVKGMQRMVELAPCSLALYDVQGKVVHVNNRFYEFIGLAEQDWGIDKIPPFSNFVHPDGFQKFAAARLHAMKTLTQVFTEMPMISGPCTHLWIDFRPLVDKNTNTLLGFMGCGIDISEQKRLESERLQAVQELAAMERVRAEEAEETRHLQEMFIDMVCHEIRNPLNGITHCNEFISASLTRVKKLLGRFDLQCRDEAENTKNEKLMKSISGEVDRGLAECESIALCATHQKSIADDVLHLSKINMKMMTLDLQSFTVTDVITQVIESFRAQLQLKETKYEIVFQDLLKTNPDLVLIGDRVRITQIIINLFTNAIKFTQNVNFKKIRVVAKVAEKSEYSPRLALRVSIEDSGIGMTLEERASLFQKFQQANQKTHTQYGGSGLGLYISKKIVEQMEGFFEVESVKGQGSTFSFTIPLAKSDVSLDNHQSASRLAPSEITISANSIASLTITDINRKILSNIVKRAGYECREAANGLKAFEMVTATCFTVVFMDVEMPVMDGKEATAKIREMETEKIRSRTPIVGVTGNARNEQIQALLAAAMDNVVVKPFKQQDISSCIGRFKLASWNVNLEQ
ncbi:hypothetical protein BDR26DRAFT_869594 [Obelidium mucronatum]|nr:hypothetical protein BDR26DRAFT_869594 [Obelidium mucronatum]